jgi:hypothetical protein
MVSLTFATSSGVSFISLRGDESNYIFHIL